MKLTPRQEAVLSLLERGALVKEIAGKQGISVNTVKKHCANIYRKARQSGATQVLEAIWRARYAQLRGPW